MSLQVLPDFTVIDESDDWIVVDKAAPLIVHPANRKPEPTLLGGLENLLSYEIANGGGLGIVNRLDRETSGVVLVAKHAAAARELGAVFQNREAEKEYLAIVSGWPDAGEWRCGEPLARAGDFGPSDIWVRQMVHPLGRSCATRFSVARRFTRGDMKFTLLRCFPETGRMHQIRVHLAAGGFPIAGDKLYSGDGSEYLEWMAEGWNPRLESRLYLSRHALHASTLRIPWRGSFFAWEAAFPTDLADFLEGREVSPPAGVISWDRNE